MISKPVTEYATVHEELRNFQYCPPALELGQHILSIFCDDGVFQEVTEVVMTELDTFTDI
jgi:hypothetical protein